MATSTRHGETPRSWIRARQMRWASGFAIAMGLAASAGCSTFQDKPPDPADVQRLAEVRALAAAPVTSFRFMRMSSFEPIGLSDLLIFTTPSEAWLLHLDGPCRGLDFDPFLGITSHTHRVSTMLDSVHVRDNPIPCRIEEIRPVNAVTLKHVDKEKTAHDQPANDEPAASGK